MSLSSSEALGNQDEQIGAALAGTKQASNHKIGGNRANSQSYPHDCPSLAVRWYHAIDVPKRKTTYGPAPKTETKPTGPPKKYLPFSVKDSRAIEAAFQNTSVGERSLDSKIQGEGTSEAIKVPVNEDYLFDVDILERELSPTYWLGNVYEVRRGSWFFQEGANLRPCEENLAIQLEEGYLKVKPWRIQSLHQRSTSQPRVLSEQPDNPSIDTAPPSNSNPVTRRSSLENLAEKPMKDGHLAPEKAKDPKVNPGSLTHRLFGPYTKSLVTYQDASIAWIVEDSMLSRMTGTVYERLAGGAHFSGTKVIRGYSESPAKKKSTKDPKITSSPSADVQRPSRSLNRRSLPADNVSADVESSPRRDLSTSGEGLPEPKPDSHVRTLERQLSSIAAQGPEEQEEEARRREMQEIRDDYRETEGDQQDRLVEHLILVSHGIGQRLGARFESFNFIHDVNELRKTLKAVYAGSEDLQALNAEIDKIPKNCRIQVLPVVWRHLLEFPMVAAKKSRKEQDLADLEGTEDEKYPSLDDITIEGVPVLRNVVADLALDILLYQTPSYRDHISRIVAQECNKTYHLFRKRNPDFNGKVSLIGHSLGSAIMFDILSDQPQESVYPEYNTTSRRAEELDLNLDFPVESFFCFGSPLGLFQMLGGRKIAGRLRDDDFDSSNNTFEPSLISKLLYKKPAVTTHHDDSVSSPKCKQLYNIFHPSDPISYRLEPLVTPAMTSLKPQLLPYTKKGIFGAPIGQGLTAIPARVGQGFSGLWSSFSTGIATSLLNKSLGISSEDAAKMSLPNIQDNKLIHHTVGVGGSASTNGVPVEHLTAEASAKIMQSSKETAQNSDNLEHPKTLIDNDIETLWGGFQKQSQNLQASEAKRFGSNQIWSETDERGRKLKREEAKVRALNTTGRIDFSIQEGAFDISFIASIASHLSYWQDEDVAHFMLSQLLSSQRLVEKDSQSG